MTIAACYLSAEGVVFGADSATTYRLPSGARYYNHAQKLFEIGEGGTAAAVTWGLGGLNVSSYRTLLAILGDNLKSQKAKSLKDVAKRWSGQFWTAYTTSPLLKDVFQRVGELKVKKPYDATAAGNLSDYRTQAEEIELNNLQSNNLVGFCIGGYVLPDRTPCAYCIVFDPTMTAAPQPTELPMGWTFYGLPTVVQRIMFGYDLQLKTRLLDSGKWSGTEFELNAIIATFELFVPILPVRDALDFVHTIILSTIKALKFSNDSLICGGPIELAVITTDRKFRWVKHKRMGFGDNGGGSACPEY